MINKEDVIMTDDEKTILIETEQRSKSNAHRLDKIENDIKDLNEENKAIYKIATSVEVMAEKIGNIDNKVNEISRKVDETSDAQKESENRFLQQISNIENAPAKQVAKNVNSIRLAIATSVITFIITGLLATLIHFAR